MSGKASDVHRAATPQQQQQQQQQQPSGLADGLTGPSREDFLTMQREVQMFGRTPGLLLITCPLSLSGCDQVG